MPEKKKIPRRLASTVIQSLKGGVVPRVGLAYIAVGRKNEIDALLHDLEIIADGGAAFRFVLGRYGSGKSFLLQTIRSYAMDLGFVVVDADLSPERRLYGSNGQGLATYRELLQNMSTKTRPEGGALPLILDRWIEEVKSETAESIDPADPSFDEKVRQRISGAVRSMDGMVHGFEFSRLLTMYYESTREGDEETRARILKWFRGEYTTRREAKEELGVSLIISDDDWYEYMKLFAFFLKRAGYKGMLIMLDELVNLYKIPNAQSRQYNYEKLLMMYNDTLQGRACGLGFLFCGTPECIEDRRRGIYSYEALRSRLEEGKFSKEGMRDLFGPVIRLEPLGAEEMLVLCGRLSDIHGVLYQYEPALSDEDLADFIRIEYGRVGAGSHITPREVIRDFVELLDILYQHPEKKVRELLTSSDFSFAEDPLSEKAGSVHVAISGSEPRNYSDFTL